MEHWTKILMLCSKNGFFHTQTANSLLTSIKYGPLGSLFRRNIKREWLSSIVNNTDAYMFPLEVLVRNYPKQWQTTSCKAATYLLPDVLENYFQILPFIESGSPCGFAAYGSTQYSDMVQSIASSCELFDYSLLSKLEPKHWLCVSFFCPPRKASDWFNYWSRYRYRWWRKFSSLPSKFYMSDVTETAMGDLQMALLMEFPWGKEKLETITLQNGENFDKWYHDLGFKKENTDLSPSVIVCLAELDLAAFAYLSNSFAEKQRGGDIKNLFQLHSKLTPYKVSILLKDTGFNLKNLKDVASQLETELKKSQVDVFPSVDSSTEDASHFSKLDEMGIPYTIVLREKALHSGIAGLRSRDTTLEEQIHITELTPKLLKYLQLNFHEVNRS